MIVLATLLPGRAAADIQAQAPADGRDIVTPPELVEFVPAEPPDPAFADEGATVILKLSITKEGTVSEAEPAAPSGGELAQAARNAAVKFRFRPALRNGKPVAARILYAYEFPARPERSPHTQPEEDRRPAPPRRAMTKPAPRLEPAVSKEPVQVTVQGYSTGTRLLRSAQAVKVVETERARRETSDMGDVLSRVPGVGVRRAGGLGSEIRFELNGLADEQIRFFLNGVPLEFAGYPFDVAKMSVNLVERIEIYGGVVPIRFGADALGGAVNVVTEDDLRGTRGSISYEAGSFDTHRFTFAGRTLVEPAGFFARLDAFVDSTANDYPIDVDVPDEQGRLSRARVYRFHDAYRAVGVSSELGFLDRAWAKRLTLRSFITSFDKEHQHNQVMTVPYGGVTFGATTLGATLRYEQVLAPAVRLDTLLGLTRTRERLVDLAECVYDWFGRCVRERRVPGEIESRPQDRLFWTHAALLRANLTWQLVEGHTVRVSAAPELVARTGDELRQLDPHARDPLNAERRLLTLVNGVEYEIDAMDDRLENIAFVKQYAQALRGEEVRPGGVSRDRERDTHRLGIGNGARFRMLDWLSAKASYEWATRLPKPNEVFGDNAFIEQNLALEPEISHNVNIALSASEHAAGLGHLRGDVTGFLRDVENLILPLGGNGLGRSYENVFGARSVGVEATIGWASPEHWLELELNGTFQDFRNTSAGGTFGDFEGDRIPNRPWLFGNASARVQLRDVLAPRDELSFSLHTRFVHEFFRGWESAGLRSTKQTLPNQGIYTGGLGYVSRSGRSALSWTAEVHNLTNATAYDFYGVQKPGRAFYVKVTAEL